MKTRIRRPKSLPTVGLNCLLGAYKRSLSGSFNNQRLISLVGTGYMYLVGKSKHHCLRIGFSLSVPTDYQFLLKRFYSLGFDLFVFFPFSMNLLSFPDILLKFFTLMTRTSYYIVKCSYFVITLR